MSFKSKQFKSKKNEEHPQTAEDGHNRKFNNTRKVRDTFRTINGLRSNVAKKANRDSSPSSRKAKNNEPILYHKISNGSWNVARFKAVHSTTASSDRVSLLVQDEDYVFVVIATSANRVKRVSGFHLYTGQELFCVQPASDAEEDFLPALAFTGLHFVIFAFKGHKCGVGSGGSHLQWTAYVHSKSVGKRVSKCSFGGGTNKDLEKLLRPPFLNCTAAYPIRPEGGESSDNEGHSDYQIALSFTECERLVFFKLNDLCGTMMFAETYFFFLPNSLSISSHTHYLAFLNHSTVVLYSLAWTRDTQEPATDILKEFHVDRVFGLAYDDSQVELKNTKVCKSKMVYPYLVVVLQKDLINPDGTKDVTICIWDLSNVLRAWPVRQIKIQIPQGQNLLAFDFNDKHLMYWNMISHQLIVHNMSDLIIKEKSNDQLMDEAVVTNIWPDLKVMPTLLILDKSKRDQLDDTESQSELSFVFQDTGLIQKCVLSTS